jgi:hypothetical protein
VSTTCFHHVVIKIRQLFLRPAIIFLVDNVTQLKRPLWWIVLTLKKYILFIVSENFAINVSQEVSDTMSKSRDLSWLVSIPYILYFSNFAIIYKSLLCLSPLVMTYLYKLFVMILFILNENIFLCYAPCMIFSRR